MNELFSNKQTSKRKNRLHIDMSTRLVVRCQYCDSENNLKKSGMYMVKVFNTHMHVCLNCFNYLNGTDYSLEQITKRLREIESSDAIQNKPPGNKDI